MANRAEDASRQPAVRELARLLQDQKRQISNLSKPQLAFSSIEDGAIPEYDTDGNLKSVIGKQFDGGHGVLVTSDPEPLQPTSPVISQGPGSLTATWDGMWMDDQGNPDETIPTPTYHSRVEVHASLDPGFQPITAATLRGTIESPRGGDVVISPLTGGPWYVKLVARSQSGNAGPESPATAGIPEDVPTPSDLQSIRDSVSGKNKIVTLDVEPAEPEDGWAEGDIWWESTGPGPAGTIIRWWNRRNDAWVEQEFDEAFFPQINIGTGTFGNLTGDRLVLNSVGREQLVTGTDEIIKNPRWMDPAYELLYGPDKIFTDNLNTVPVAEIDGASEWKWDVNPDNLRFGQPHQLYIGGSVAGSGKWQHMPLGPSFPAFGGEKFFIGMDTYGGDATMYVTLLLVPFDASGNRITGVEIHINSDVLDEDRTWTSRSKVVQLPAGTVRVQPWIEKQGTAGTGASGYVMVGQVSVRRAMVGGGPGGTETELSGAGLRLFGEDGSEVVNLTSTPPNYLLIRNSDGDTLSSIDDTGGITGQELNITSDPTFAGYPLLGNTSVDGFHSTGGSGLLDYLPRGIVARGYRAMNTAPTATNQEREILELSYYRYGGRAYKIIVTPWSCYIDGAYGYLKCYYTTDGSRPTMNSNLLQVKTVRNTSTDGTMMDMGTEWYDLADTGDGRRRYLFTYEALNGSMTIFGNSRDGSQFRVWVEDIGLSVVETGIDRTGYRSNGGTAPSAPVTEEKQNYSKTYLATGWRSYLPNGDTYNYSTANMFQGTSPAGFGDLSSNAVFDSFTGDLSGATVTSVEAYFYFRAWYYNSGGVANIQLHADLGGVNSTRAPQTFAVQATNWQAGEGRWVKIPSQFWNGFKTGEWRGVGLAGSGYSRYGYANGASTRIRIKYSK